MSIIGDFAGTAVAAVQVPEYSPSRPVTVARQAPFHAWADLLADHRPRITILLEASYKAQEPVAPPLSRCASAVQLPPKFCPALDDALQDPRSSAPDAKTAEQAKIAITRAAAMSYNLPTLRLRGVIDLGDGGAVPKWRTVLLHRVRIENLRS